ncbi:hypothetical protein LY78DRAFT_231291 [Colletotrichum sublineola]|nr:hypothetical protein LY78DRAFT_231291 [Colletotrichum sublineola]
MYSIAVTLQAAYIFFFFSFGCALLRTWVHRRGRYGVTVHSIAEKICTAAMYLFPLIKAHMYFGTIPSSVIHAMGTDTEWYRVSIASAAFFVVFFYYFLFYFVGCSKKYPEFVPLSGVHAVYLVVSFSLSHFAHLPAPHPLHPSPGPSSIHPVPSFYVNSFSFSVFFFFFPLSTESYFLSSPSVGMLAPRRRRTYTLVTPRYRGRISYFSYLPIKVPGGGAHHHPSIHPSSDGCFLYLHPSQSLSSALPFPLHLLFASVL